MNKYWVNLKGLSGKEKKSHCTLWAAWSVKSKDNKADKDADWVIGGVPGMQEGDWSQSGGGDQHDGKEANAEKWADVYDEEINGEDEECWEDGWEGTAGANDESQSWYQQPENHYISHEGSGEQSYSREAGGEDWSQNGYGNEEGEGHEIDNGGYEEAVREGEVSYEDHGEGGGYEEAIEEKEACHEEVSYEDHGEGGGYEEAIEEKEACHEDHGEGEGHEHYEEDAGCDEGQGDEFYEDWDEW
jgi:hypothetical protein